MRNSSKKPKVYFDHTSTTRQLPTTHRTTHPRNLSINSRGQTLESRAPTATLQWKVSDDWLAGDSRDLGLDEVGTSWEDIPDEPYESTFPIKVKPKRSEIYEARWIYVGQYTIWLTALFLFSHGPIMFGKRSIALCIWMSLYAGRGDINICTIHARTAAPQIHNIAVMNATTPRWSARNVV